MIGRSFLLPSSPAAVRAMGLDLRAAVLEQLHAGRRAWSASDRRPCAALPAVALPFPRSFPVLLSLGGVS